MSTIPIKLYGCITTKSNDCMIIAKIGILNQDPKVCIITPRYKSSSPQVCSGARIKVSNNVTIVKWLSNVNLCVYIRYIDGIIRTNTVIING